MSLFVVTMNTNDALCTNSRASHEDAARRWGASYVEMRDPWGSLSHLGIFGTKLELDRLPLAAPCRVVWLDADTVVRADCPSLFDLVAPGCFGGVCNFQGDTHGGDPFPDHADWYAQVASQMGSPSRYDPARYINGGVLVFDLPGHACVWQHIRITLPDLAVDPMYEQTALNVAIADLGIPLIILPREFNRIGLAAWRGGAVMAHYIHHLANIADLRGDKHGPLSQVNWQMIRSIP